MKNKRTHIFYAPNFGEVEVEGLYWFGPVHLSVCPSVTLAYGHKPLRDRILKYYMWNRYEN